MGPSAATLLPRAGHAFELSMCGARRCSGRPARTRAAPPASASGRRRPSLGPGFKGSAGAPRSRRPGHHASCVVVERWVEGVSFWSRGRHPGWRHASARICSTRFIGAIGGRCLWCTLAPSFIGDSGAFLCIPMKIGVKSEHHCVMRAEGRGTVWQLGRSLRAAPRLAPAPPARLL
jgi:hypothetical protein